MQSKVARGLVREATSYMLDYSTQEDDLRGAFEAFGKVSSAKIIIDKATGRSKGFGFVEMPEDGEAQTAIDKLNETELNGKVIVVKKAKPKDATSTRSGGGSRYGRGGGGYNREGNY
ncbi:hypothetical protein CHS0354_023914 [Potamilus streckersoni]|uniref:RRM domain-containing protein n=1 Tax=Potamilus streckersoni TaxID=2493646 RepID=A0AAE0RZW9_9BIVA|nr:hypothetical protein CHS0354_023914 [Potamilus streckersoni]